LAGQLNGAFNEPSIQVSLDEKLSEGHQRSFAEGSLLALEAIEDQRPSPIHHGRLNHLVI
jgi:hypothetical protein